MAKNKYKRENLYTVIVWFKDNFGAMRAAKYRNIECDKPGTWERSKLFFKEKFPTAQYCNKYGGITREYKGREYF